MLKNMLGFIVLALGAFTLNGCEEGTGLKDDYDIEIISKVEPFDYDLEVNETGEMTVSLTDYDDSAYAFSLWRDTSDASILSEQKVFTFTLEDRDYEIEAVFETLEDNTDDEQSSGDEDGNDDKKNPGNEDETGNDEESDNDDETGNDEDPDDVDETGDDEESDEDETGNDEDPDDVDETRDDDAYDEPEQVYSTAFESTDVGFWSDYDTYTFDGVDWIMNNTSNAVYENQDRYNGDASIRIDNESDSFIEMSDGFNEVHSVSFAAANTYMDTGGALELSVSSDGESWVGLAEEDLSDSLETYEYVLDFSTLEGLDYEDTVYFRIDGVSDRINIDDFTIFGGSESTAPQPDDPDEDDGSTGGEDDPGDEDGGEDPVLDGDLEELLDADLMDYYHAAEGLYGDDLEAALRNTIDSDVNHLSYGDAWTVLQESDRDPDNSDNVLLVYTRESVNGPATYPTWNREHVWPQSKLESSGAKTDVHHLKPSDLQENSSRGNLPFGESGSTYEPPDEVKGDVARMVFYMDARYPSLNIAPSTIGDLGTLLQWHEEDPVDAFEENRNDVIHSHQNNRNPFIDHPHLALLMYHDHSDVALD